MSMQTISARRGEADSLQFRVLYVICFGIFLFAATVQALLPWRWFSRAEGEVQHSILAQAKNAAGICAGYVFMV
ncbi:MAG: hypothetical protein AAGF48_04295 [Pseudomonadota bacterium]